jgi:hypothetical protein
MCAGQRGLAIAVNRQLVFSIRLDPQDAAARRQRKEAELNALNNGVSVLPENGDGHRSVAAAAVPRGNGTHEEAEDPQLGMFFGRAPGLASCGLYHRRLLKEPTHAFPA